MEYIVVLNSEEMGSDVELGTILLKGFLRKILEKDTLPKALVLYNAAVKLPFDETILEIIKEYDSNQIEILSCGTCLDFYDLEVKVGIRSTMQ